MRIARWYCPEGRQTFSLLPDFLAARRPGLLASIEHSVAVALSAESMEAAADALRGPEVTLPSAVCWLRRRTQAVKTALAHVMPRTAIGSLAEQPAPEIDLDQGCVLFPLLPVALAGDPEPYPAAAGFPGGTECRAAARCAQPTRDGT